MEIIVDCQGGLGNQLFQYAKALSLCKQAGRDFRITSSLVRLNFQSRNSRFTKRVFALDAYGIGVKTSYFKSFLTIDGSMLNSNYLANLLPKILQRFSFGIFAVIDENLPNDFDLSERRIVVLKGFWQDPRHLIEFQEFFRSHFNIQVPISQTYIELKDFISRHKVLIIHVRRGDYVSNQKAANYHGALTLDYFRESFSQASQQIFFQATVIFTDDGSFVRENFGFIPNLTVIPESEELTAPEILDLMRFGDALVISNSSLSWWAAFLGHSELRPIFAPSPWFRKETKEIYLEHWHQIEARFEKG